MRSRPCSGRRKDISSWGTRHFTQSEGGGKVPHAENDPAMRTARVSSFFSLFSASPPGPVKLASQSLSTLTPPSRSFIRTFRPLMYLTTRNAQRLEKTVTESRRTVIQLLHLVTHDYSGKVDGFQGISALRASSPILPIE